MNKFSITKSVQAFWPMIVVFAWDALVNNPFGLYGLWPNLDILMHILGGAVTAWSLTRLWLVVPPAWRPVIKPAVAMYVFGLGIVALITIAWEIYEVAFDFMYPFPVPMTVVDTLADMVNGLLGASGFWLAKYRIQGAGAATKVGKRRN